jgi:DNA-directed RNA polymerase subunit H (RpoH/RPB5)
MSHEIGKISHKIFMDAVEMLEKRGFDDVAILAIEFDTEDVRTKKRGQRRKDAKKDEQLKVDVQDDDFDLRELSESTDFSDESESETDYSQYKVAQIKEILKSKHLRTVGKRDELIERLEDYKKRKRKAAKKNAGKKSSVNEEEKDTNAKVLIYTKDEYEDEEFYDDTIYPLFETHYIMLVDYQEDASDRKSKDSFKRIVLLHVGVHENDDREKNSPGKNIRDAQDVYNYARFTNFMWDNKIPIDECIVLCKDRITKNADNNELLNFGVVKHKDRVILPANPIRAQYFTPEELIFYNSIFGSRYTKMTDLEVQDLFNELQIKNGKNLPKLITGDPIVKYYGWYIGDVIKIYRRSVGLPTIVDCSISYAIVVHGTWKEFKENVDVVPNEWQDWYEE